jgi:hypothetical protein
LEAFGTTISSKKATSNKYSLTLSCKCYFLKILDLVTALVNFLRIDPDTIIDLARLGNLLEVSEFVDIRGKEHLVALVASTEQRRMPAGEIVDFLNNYHNYEDSFDLDEFRRIFSMCKT